MANNVAFERQGAVATVTFDRPKALNALNPETLAELAEVAVAIEGDRSVRAVVVTGAGDKAFVAGADIAAMEQMSAVEARRFARVGQSTFRKLELLPQPVIAAVNGFALGGGLELALACDLILASTAARFGQPEINLGIVPGFGGTQRLPARVGIARAREMIYSGAMIDAEEAFRIGLVNRVVEPEKLIDEAVTLARSLAEKAPVAMQQAKAAIGASADLDLENGCRYESEAFAVCFGTEDRSEGMRAFLEKRAAKFSGK
jgi:enoyl-CoA hydratase